jgi:sulfoxide reductase heme-binding subunit YedZ
VSSSLVAAAGPSAYWYLTRGSGVVALLLLTASICLGIAGKLRWRTRSLPRFAVAGLHRNLTLLAIVFVGFHIATTVLDGYAPIAWKDAFVPFLSSYRPLWLGLGALAFDLLLALVVSSLLRAHIGLRVWRGVHWLAYVSWPVALVHALGTGTDARVGWMQLVAVSCTLAVALSIALRLAASPSASARRLLAAAAAATVVVAVFAWYRSGPGATGWAARAGTPTALVAHRAVVTRPRTQLANLPQSFTAQFIGRISQSQSGDGVVDVRIDGSLRGGLKGRLRLVLQGVPLDEGGVSMTSSGVAFALAGSPVYEGSVTGLEGNQVAARVTSGSTALDLRLELRLESSSVSGTVHGWLA